MAEGKCWVKEKVASPKHMCWWEQRFFFPITGQKAWRFHMILPKICGSLWKAGQWQPKQCSLYFVKVFCCIPVGYFYNFLLHEINHQLFEGTPCTSTFSAWQLMNRGSRIPNCLCQTGQLTQEQIVMANVMAFLWKHSWDPRNHSPFPGGWHI